MNTRRFHRICLFLIPALLLGLRLPASADDDWSGQVRLLADRCELLDAVGEIHANGHVRLEMRTGIVTADSVVCSFIHDPETSRRVITRISAFGGVTLTEHRQLDSGEMVDVDVSGVELDIQRRPDGAYGTVKDARLRLSNPAVSDLAALFQGHSIEFSERGADRTIIVREGTLTGCDRDDPHYRIEAREIEFIQDQFVIARHAAVRLWGVKIISAPTLRFGLGKEQGQSLLPRLGVSETSGAFVRWAYDLPVKRQGIYDVLLQYSTRRSATWRVRAEGTQPVRFFLYAAGKEELPNRRVSGIVLSSLPRVGLRAQLKPLTLTADYGYYRESPSGVTEHRRSIEAVLDTPEWRPISWAHLSAEGSIRRSWYPDGDPFKASTGDVSFDLDLSQTTMLRLGFRRSWTNHQTPFLFDDIDIIREARAGFKLTRSWGELNFLVRYDLEEQDVYGYEVSIARNAHCLTPRITYGSRDKSIGLEVGIPGF